MKAKGGNWTSGGPHQFVHAPKIFVPGTKMLFPGISDPSELADLLAYLNTLKKHAGSGMRFNLGVND